MRNETRIPAFPVLFKLFNIELKLSAIAVRRERGERGGNVNR